MQTLPAGVELRPLDRHADDRGSFLEMYRVSWFQDRSPALQWNLVRSRAGTLRGVHVHVVHSDFWLLVEGVATVGLCDLRRHSPTFRLAVDLPVRAGDPVLVVIPRGVAHGFLFHQPSLHVYSVTSYWDPADELGCRWDDPDLGIQWPAGAPPTLSDRDQAAPSLAALMATIEPQQPELCGPPSAPPGSGPTRR